MADIKPNFDKMTDDEIYAWILNEAARLRKIKLINNEVKNENKRINKKTRTTEKTTWKY